MLTLHVLGVVVAFGGTAAYPLWFLMVRSGTPEQRAFFHRAQAKLGKLLIVPGMVVILATGAWLASDHDIWGAAWVLVPLVILVAIAVLGIGFLGPSEERLARQAAAGADQEYNVLFKRVRFATWAALVLVAAATLMMVARVPHGESGSGTAGVSGGAAVAADAGCLSCHRIGSEGAEHPGGDLSTVGSHLSPSEIRERLVDPPAGMPSYDDLPAEKLSALVTYLAGLR